MTAATAKARLSHEALAAEDKAATAMLVALHRLAQQSTLYDANNEAQRHALEATAKAAQDYGSVTGRNLTFFFSERAVYVGRRLLRGSRGIYQSASHLRVLLSKMGVSQITIGHDVPLDDLRALQASLAVAIREPQNAAPPAELSRVRLKAGRPPGDYAEFDGLSPEERAVKVYSLAIVIVRRFLEQLQAGQWEINAHVRRISEELIALAETANPALLAATVSRPPHDDAERVVSSALLALCMARQLTTDQRLLRWLATGALVCDVGRLRVAGVDAAGDPRRGMRLPILGEGQGSELPGATAFVTTALGRLTDAGMMRSVVVYEALHIEHAEETGPIYGGERGPAMLSRLLAAARRFEDGLGEGKAAADVVAGLIKSANDEVDRWIVQLLMATLNVLPTGTIVELDSGHWARVVSPPADRIDYGRPLVRWVSRPGEEVESKYIDLKDPDAAHIRIVGIVAALDEQEAYAPDDHTAEADEAQGDRDSAHTGVRVRRSQGSLPALHPFSDVPADSDAPPSSEPPPPLVARGRPKASGTLAKNPLIHLLVYLLDNQLSGTLLLSESPIHRHAIVLERGTPQKASTADPVPAGEAVQQVVNQIGHMMRLGPSTRFAFYESADFLEVEPEVDGVDPLAIIMMGVRKHTDYDTIDTVLPKVANTELAIHPQSKPELLRLRPAERAVINLMASKKLTLNTLLAEDDIDEDAAQRLIYALTILRFLTTGSARGPVGCG